ncbi:MAG: hypothetical protein U1C54_11175 [Xanthomonadaceae bacterium]|nr:hypothetical protein [Xanthomonadaceae bacterium]MDZ4379468.1 hypothetical protein [Xanthomonadaceae bacterium]
MDGSTSGWPHSLRDALRIAALLGTIICRDMPQKNLNASRSLTSKAPAAVRIFARISPLRLPSPHHKGAAHVSFVAATRHIPGAGTNH